MQLAHIIYHCSGTFGYCLGNSGHWAGCDLEGQWYQQQYGAFSSYYIALRAKYRYDMFIGAAVCILETHAPSVQDPVRGLARMVQVSPNTIVIDLALKGLPSGEYYATIREKGDISQGAMSTGGIWEDSKGHLCKLEVDPKGTASVLLDKQVAIWELIGRSMVVSRQQEGAFEQNLEDTLVGVIARSAGVWENDKTVSSLVKLHYQIKETNFRIEVPWFRLC